MSSPAPLQTALHAWHKAHGGRLVDFAGWSMPVQYTSIVEEHKAVRSGVGLFDVSHMGRIGFSGPDAVGWLERVTTNHVAKLDPGRIQYSLMVDETGGVLDDILVYRGVEGDYSIVCNASNRSKVLARLDAHRPPGPETALSDRTLATAMIAVQGPKALATLGPLCSAPLDGLGYYRSLAAEVAGAPCLVSRTGYTGEDGFEISFADDRAVAVWEALLGAGRPSGIAPCGLAARDTLRLEAAMPLYGHEMDETVNPYAAGLGWAVKLEKGEFVGREALRRCQADPKRARVGLALDGKRIARQGTPVLDDGRLVGLVTSGTFAPTLGRSLAMALVDPSVAAPGTVVTLDVRGHAEPARVVPLPFYRKAS